MNLDKKQLKEFLQLLEALLSVEGNEWMKDELISVLNRKGISLNLSEDLGKNYSPKIDKIWEYMSLDTPLLVDYSLFPESIRWQLERDELEMRKYRFGKVLMDKNVGFRVEYEEFCRCAVLQVEQLINFYLLTKFKDKKLNSTLFNSKIKPYIQDYEEYKDYWGSFQDISLSVKITYFIEFFKMDDDIKKCLKNIRKVRNILSHRSVVLKNRSEIKSEYKEVLSKDYELLTDAERKRLSEYWVLIFIKKSNFDIVVKSLLNIVYKVVKSLGLEVNLNEDKASKKEAKGGDVLGMLNKEKGETLAPSLAPSDTAIPSFDPNPILGQSTGTRLSGPTDGTKFLTADDVVFDNDGNIIKSIKK